MELARFAHAAMHEIMFYSKPSNLIANKRKRHKTKPYILKSIPTPPTKMLLN